MNPLKTLTLAFSTLFLLTACGGGSNDSSGAGSADLNTGTESASGQTSSGTDDSAGPTTYTGNGNVTLSADGLPSISEEFEVTVVVDGSTVTPTVDGESVTAPLDGDSFTTSLTITESDDDLTCSGTAIISGTVTGDTVSGTISGDGSCSGDGIETPVQLSGSFSASR